VTAEAVLLVEPPSRHFDGDRLFDRRDPALGRDGAREPFALLRESLAARGVPCHTADRIDEVAARRYLYVALALRPRARRLLRRADVVASAIFTLECPIVDPWTYRGLPEAGRRFRRLYSYAGAEALLPFTGAPVEVRPFRIPQALDAARDELWARRDRGFLVMINANKRPRLRRGELYEERLRALAAFERHGEIDLYGMGWDGAAYRVGRRFRPPWVVGRALHAAASVSSRRWPGPLLAAARRAWRGPCAVKAEVLSRYAFALAFENMRLEGWITEKLFDCLAVGTVPVYLGAPDIARHLPADCFVDARAFGSYEELRRFLRAMPERERERAREAGRAFLASEGFRPFRAATFAGLLEDIVEQDAGPGVGPAAGHVAARPVGRGRGPGGGSDGR
jgi:hypothetical protein